MSEERPFDGVEYTRRPYALQTSSLREAYQLARNKEFVNGKHYRTPCLAYEALRCWERVAELATARGKWRLVAEAKEGIDRCLATERDYAIARASGHERPRGPTYFVQL